MNKYSIKICRVNDIHTTRFLARCKIDFVGLHAIFGLPNKKQLIQFQKIIKELQKYYPETKTVLVTRIINPRTLVDVYKKMPTDFVQWSAPISKRDKEFFLSYVKKLRQNVNIFNVLSSSESNMTYSYKDIVGKYVIIDKKFAGGTGTQTPKELLVELTKSLKGKYILLAGGMGRVNIRSWLGTIPVAGVDIMSSMEVSSNDKRKDLKKIARYLKENRGETTLPILELPVKSDAFYTKVSTLRGAIRAINKGSDRILVERSMTGQKLATKIKSLNPFAQVEIVTPSSQKFMR